LKVFFLTICCSKLPARLISSLTTTDPLSEVCWETSVGTDAADIVGGLHSWNGTTAAVLRDSLVSALLNACPFIAVSTSASSADGDSEHGILKCSNSNSSPLSISAVSEETLLVPSKEHSSSAMFCFDLDNLVVSQHVTVNSEMITPYAITLSAIRAQLSKHMTTVQGDNSGEPLFSNLWHQYVISLYDARSGWMAINNVHSSWLSSCTRSMDQIEQKACCSRSSFLSSSRTNLFRWQSWVLP